PLWYSGLGMELEKRLLEHRRPEGGAGPVVVDRGALAAEQGGGLPYGGGGPWAAAQRVLGAGGPNRGGRHSAEADGDPLDDTAGGLQREGDGHAGDVIPPPRGDLVEGDRRGQRQRDAHRPDRLGRLLHGLPVAGEVVGQWDLAFATRPGQHDRRLQGQQRGRGVPDGGGGAQVAAQRGAVADQPGRELRPELVEQRDPPVQQPLGLREGERGAELDLGWADTERAQLGQL